MKVVIQVTYLTFGGMPTALAETVNHSPWSVRSLSIQMYKPSIGGDDGRSRTVLHLQS